MKTLIGALLLVTMLGCGDDKPPQSQPPVPPPQIAEYVIGGRIDSLSVYWPGDVENPKFRWFTHIGFVHDDGLMQEMNLCDNQQLLHPGTRVAMKIRGVPGAVHGCYEVVEMRKLD